MDTMASGSGSGTSDPTNFLEEISKMMYGFGDSSSPNPATVRFIEFIIRRHQLSILKEAYQVSVARGKIKIRNYELIYLLQQNKNILKLKRLHDLQISQDKVEKIHILTQPEPDIYSASARKMKKKGRTHIKIMKKLGGIKDVQKINHDYLGHLRKVRAKNASDMMPAGEYQPFQEARCTSFRTSTVYKDGLVKFKKWIDCDNNFRITYSGLEVLCFLAYETVADIIDAVLLVRKGKIVGHRFGFQLNNRFSLRWPITVHEVNEALEMYFTPKLWLNNLFYKNMGLDYVAE